MKQMTIVALAVSLLSVDAFAIGDRPNVFIAMSDDQSWPHCSAYGSTMVDTPSFDSVADSGVLFTNAFCPSPGCSPSRAAFLTGLHTWQIEHAGTHASYFPKRYPVFPDLLDQAGYFVGYTGKGWGPGNWKKSGRNRNPAGTSFGGRGKYVDGFQSFLDKLPEDTPFCFWFGSGDAHRGYQKGSGLKSGKKLSQAEVPAFLPDAPEIRSDLLDYAFEVDRFDRDVGSMLELLASRQLLENTIVIVTSDNGMPFPRAKANCYEFGLHMPLAIQWTAQVPGGRKVEDLIGFVDLTATIYQACGVTPPRGLAGRSIVDILTSSSSGIVDSTRTEVYAARERHSSSRYNSLGYPQRCLRTREYLYIRNLKPERWPAGAPRRFTKALWSESGAMVAQTLGGFGAYHDIDGCPSLDFLLRARANPELGRYLDLAVARRPAEELFAVTRDPGCLTNLAYDPKYEAVRDQLRDQLTSYLKQSRDPRVLGNGDVWETYPRVSGLRWFPKPDWAKSNPKDVPDQPWLEQRRPRGR